MTPVRILILNEITENLGLCESPGPMQDHLFELNESGCWIDRGRIRGEALADTISFLENGCGHINIHFLSRSDVDPSIREFVDFICQKGVPEIFSISHASGRRTCNLGPWVRDIVSGLAWNVSVGEIMAIIEEDLDSLLGVETEHDRIAGYSTMEKLISSIQTSIFA